MKGFSDNENGKNFYIFCRPCPANFHDSERPETKTNKNEQNNANKQKTTKVSIATKPIKHIFSGNFTHAEGATVFCSSYEQYI